MVQVAKLHQIVLVGLVNEVMWLITFIANHRNLIIIFSTFYLILLFLVSQAWSMNPGTIENAICLFLFGYFMGSINFLFEKYILKMQINIFHSILLSYMYTILAIGFSGYQLVTQFSLNIPIEFIFVVPGFVIVPNGLIYKVAKQKGW